MNDYEVRHRPGRGHERKRKLEQSESSEEGDNSEGTEVSALEEEDETDGESESTRVQSQVVGTKGKARRDLGPGGPKKGEQTTQSVSKVRATTRSGSGKTSKSITSRREATPAKSPVSKKQRVEVEQRTDEETGSSSGTESTEGSDEGSEEESTEAKVKQIPKSTRKTLKSVKSPTYAARATAETREVTERKESTPKVGRKALETPKLNVKSAKNGGSGGAAETTPRRSAGGPQRKGGVTSVSNNL